MGRAGAMKLHDNCFFHGSALSVLSFVTAIGLSYTFFWYTSAAFGANVFFAQKVSYTIACGATLVAVAIALKRNWAWKLSSGSMPRIFSLMILLGFILLLSGGDDSMGLARVIGGAVLVGFSNAWLMAAGYLGLSYCERDDALIAGAAFAAPLAKFATLFQDGGMAFLFVVAFAACAVLLLGVADFGDIFRYTGRAVDELDSKSKQTGKRGSAVLLLCMQMLFVMAAVLCAAYSPNGMWSLESSLPSVCGSAVACFSAVPLFYFLGKKIADRVVLVARIFAFGISTGLVLFFFLEPSLPPFLRGLLLGLIHLSAAVAFDLVALLLTATKKQSQSVLLLLVAVNSLVVFGVLVYTLAGFSLSLQFPIVGAAYALMVTVVFLMPEKRLVQEREKSSSLESSCERVSSRFGLTKREAEVLTLLATGRSRSFIEKELFIATGTAKTHISNVYKKLGVHGKQELIDLVWDEAEESSQMRNET